LGTIQPGFKRAAPDPAGWKERSGRECGAAAVPVPAVHTEQTENLGDSLQSLCGGLLEIAGKGMVLHDPHTRGSGEEQEGGAAEEIGAGGREHADRTCTASSPPASVRAVGGPKVGGRRRGLGTVSPIQMQPVERVGTDAPCRAMFKIANVGSSVRSVRHFEQWVHSQETAENQIVYGNHYTSYGRERASSTASRSKHARFLSEGNRFITNAEL
jgi:hypothetical protein